MSIGVNFSNIISLNSDYKKPIFRLNYCDSPYGVNSLGYGCEYYDDTLNSGLNSTELVFVGKDNILSYDWGNGVPPGVSTVKNYKAKYYGYFYAEYSGIYTFYVSKNINDHVYFEFDSNLTSNVEASTGIFTNPTRIIDSGYGLSGETLTVTSYLNEGFFYAFRLSYAHKDGNGYVVLRYSEPDMNANYDGYYSDYDSSGLYHPIIAKHKKVMSAGSVIYDASWIDYGDAKFLPYSDITSVQSIKFTQNLNQSNILEFSVPLIVATNTALISGLEGYRYDSTYECYVDNITNIPLREGRIIRYYGGYSSDTGNSFIEDNSLITNGNMERWVASSWCGGTYRPIGWGCSSEPTNLKITRNSNSSYVYNEYYSLQISGTQLSNTTGNALVNPVALHANGYKEVPFPVSMSGYYTFGTWVYKRAASPVVSGGLDFDLVVYDKRQLSPIQFNLMSGHITSAYDDKWTWIQSTIQITGLNASKAVLRWRPLLNTYTSPVIFFFDGMKLVSGQSITSSYVIEDYSDLVQRFEGIVTDISVTRSNNGGTLDIKCQDFLYLPITSIVENCPNNASYAMFDYTSRNITTEPDGVTRPMTYDAWPIINTVRDLCIKGGIDPKKLYGRKKILDRTNKVVYGDYFMQDKEVRLRRKSKYGSPYLAGNDPNSDEEYIWKLNFGDSIYDSIVDFSNTYGYIFGCSNNGNIVFSTVNTPITHIVNTGYCDWIGSGWIIRDESYWKEVNDLRADAGTYIGGIREVSESLPRVNRIFKGSSFVINFVKDNIPANTGLYITAAPSWSIPTNEFPRDIFPTPSQAIYTKSPFGIMYGRYPTTSPLTTLSYQMTSSFFVSTFSGGGYTSTEEKVVGNIITGVGTNSSGNFFTYLNPSGYSVTQIDVNTVVFVGPNRYTSASNHPKWNTGAWWKLEFLCGTFTSSGGPYNMTVTNTAIYSGYVDPKTNSGYNTYTKISHTFTNLDPTKFYGVQYRLYEHWDGVTSGLIVNTGSAAYNVLKQAPRDLTNNTDPYYYTDFLDTKYIKKLYGYGFINGRFLFRPLKSFTISSLTFCSPIDTPNIFAKQVGRNDPELFDVACDIYIGRQINIDPFAALSPETKVKAGYRRPPIGSLDSRSGTYYHTINFDSTVGVTSGLTYIIYFVTSGATKETQILDDYANDLLLFKAHCAPIINNNTICNACHVTGVWGTSLEFPTGYYTDSGSFKSVLPASAGKSFSVYPHFTFNRPESTLTTSKFTVSTVNLYTNVLGTYTIVSSWKVNNWYIDRTNDVTKSYRYPSDGIGFDGVNPCIFYISPDMIAKRESGYSISYGDYLLEIISSGDVGVTGTKITSVDVFDEDIYDRKFAFSTSTNIKSLGIARTTDDIRNDIIVVGDLIGAFRDFNTKQVVNQNNPIYQYIYSRATDVSSINDPSARNSIGRKKPFVIYEPSIVDQKHADWLAQAVLYRYRNLKKVPSWQSFGIPFIEPNDNIIVIDKYNEGSLKDSADNPNQWITSINESISNKDYSMDFSTTPYDPWSSFIQAKTPNIDKFGGNAFINIKMTDSYGRLRGNRYLGGTGNLIEDIDFDVYESDSGNKLLATYDQVIDGDVVIKVMTKKVLNFTQEQPVAYLVGGYDPEIGEIPEYREWGTNNKVYWDGVDQEGYSRRRLGQSYITTGISGENLLIINNDPFIEDYSAAGFYAASGEYFVRFIIMPRDSRYTRQVIDTHTLPREFNQEMANRLSIPTTTESYSQSFFIKWGNTLPVYMTVSGSSASISGGNFRNITYPSMNYFYEDENQSNGILFTLSLESSYAYSRSVYYTVDVDHLWALGYTFRLREDIVSPPLGWPRYHDTMYGTYDSNNWITAYCLGMYGYYVSTILGRPDEEVIEKNEHGTIYAIIKDFGSEGGDFRYINLTPQFPAGGSQRLRARDWGMLGLIYPDDLRSRLNSNGLPEQVILHDIHPKIVEGPFVANSGHSYRIYQWFNVPYTLYTNKYIDTKLHTLSNNRPIQFYYNPVNNAGGTWEFNAAPDMTDVQYNHFKNSLALAAYYAGPNNGSGDGRVRLMTSHVYQVKISIWDGTGRMVGSLSQKVAIPSSHAHPIYGLWSASGAQHTHKSGKALKMTSADLGNRYFEAVDEYYDMRTKNVPGFTDGLYTYGIGYHNISGLASFGRFTWHGHWIDSAWSSNRVDEYVPLNVLNDIQSNTQNNMLFDCSHWFVYDTTVTGNNDNIVFGAANYDTEAKVPFYYDSVSGLTALTDIYTYGVDGFGNYSAKVIRYYTSPKGLQMPLNYGLHTNERGDPNFTIISSMQCYLDDNFVTSSDTKPLRPVVRHGHTKTYQYLKDNKLHNFYSGANTTFSNWKITGFINTLGIEFEIPKTHQVAIHTKGSGWGGDCKWFLEFQYACVSFDWYRRSTVEPFYWVEDEDDGNTGSIDNIKYTLRGQSAHTFWTKDDLGENSYDAQANGMVDYFINIYSSNIADKMWYYVDLQLPYGSGLNNTYYKNFLEKFDFLHGGWSDSVKGKEDTKE